MWGELARGCQLPDRPRRQAGRMMRQGLPPGALGGEFITEMCLPSAQQQQPLCLPSLMLSLGFLGPP